MQKILLGLFLVCAMNDKILASEHDPYGRLVTKTTVRLMKKHKIPGVAIAIIDHNKSYTYVFGVANNANNTPITNKTIFEVGSITKLFTALLFTKTAGSLNIQLNDTLTEYFPELNKNQFLHKVTFEKLLTHTSGLPHNAPETIAKSYQVLDYLLHWEPINAIGTRWQYSNIGIGLVGMILQNKSHRTINQLYKEQILEPLGMNPIGVEIDKNFLPELAQSYLEDGKTAPNFFDTQEPYPSAWGLKASIKDMSCFLRAAIGLNISQDLRQAMQNTQTPRLMVGNMQQGLVWRIHSIQNKTLLYEADKMDLGLLPIKWLSKKQQVFCANKLIDKTGAHNGFRSYIAVIPSKQLGIVILLNKSISLGLITNVGRKIIFSKNKD
ncbi:MAG TPA: hypothetical protein DEG23_00745 [Coxiellaceae bacterium]|nr:hypothetical protein [Coxiellaceae bacterium]HBY55331.1 hypothetical protein [Coxiellaceae bacterium]